VNNYATQLTKIYSSKWTLILFHFLKTIETELYRKPELLTTKIQRICIWEEKSATLGIFCIRMRKIWIRMRIPTASTPACGTSLTSTKGDI